jgi:autotransporter-associated beta strand protein/adhesin HecA-like repeat protein
VAGAVTLASGSIVDSVGGGHAHGSSYTVQSGVVSAVLGGAGSALTKTTAGTVTLSGQTLTPAARMWMPERSSLARRTRFPRAERRRSMAARSPSAPPMDWPLGGAVNVNGGTLDLAGFSSTAGAVTLTSGSIVNSGGAGATLSASSYTLQSGTVSAVLGGALSPLTKTGSGTVTLTAANTYGGATTVSAGVLNVSAAQTGGGAFSVMTAPLLGVDLTAAGQTLNTSSLTLGSATGASITFSLGTLGNTTAPVINAGSLTLNGTDVVNISGSGLSVGEFPLIAYTGSIGGFGSLAGDAPARIVASLDTTSIPGLVQLDVTAYDYPKWTGAVNGNWDLDPTGLGQQGTLNWVTAISGVATRYLQGTGGTDSVLFDDSAAATATVVGGATTVNLTTTLTPVSVTVNNSALNYIFSGPGALSGSHRHSEGRHRHADHRQYRRQ